MKPQRMANWPPLKSCCRRCLASLLSFGIPAAATQEGRSGAGWRRYSAPAAARPRGREEETAPSYGGPGAVPRGGGRGDGGREVPSATSGACGRLRPGAWCCCGGGGGTEHAGEANEGEGVI